MEQILKSLLLKQGYEFIGLVNSDKNIWGYAKNGQFHFCNDALIEINRCSIGLNAGVIALTLKEDRIIQLNDSETFTNAVIIDEENNILCHKQKTILEQLTGKCTNYLLKRINEQSLIVVTRRWDMYVCESTNESLYGSRLTKDPYFTYGWDNTQIIIINGKLEPTLNFYMFLNGYYFFKVEDEPISTNSRIYNGHEFIYEGITPYVWLHNNRKIHLVSFCEEREGYYKSIDIVNIESLSFPTHIDVSLYAGNKDALISDCTTNLFSDTHLVIPYADRRGALIIQYHQHITAYCINFEDKGTPKVLNGNLLKVTQECYMADLVEVNYYDINGNHLVIPHKAHTFTPFCINNKSLFNKIDKLYGVIDLISCEIVLPPIFENVSELGYDDNGWNFEVRYCNIVDGQRQQFKGLYSSKKGFISMSVN